METAACNAKSRDKLDRMLLIASEAEGANTGCFVIPILPPTGTDDVPYVICCTLVTLIWTHNDEYITVQDIPTKDFKEKLRSHHTVFVSETVFVKKDRTSSAPLTSRKEVMSR